VNDTSSETGPDGAAALPPPSPTEVAPWLLPAGVRLERFALPRLYGFRMRGRERLPATGGVLLVLNHNADCDPAFVTLACWPRPALYLGAARHFENPAMAWLLGGLGGIPLRTDRPDVLALRRAREHLATGRLLAVFPEGSPSFSDRLAPFRGGIGLLALTPGVTVVPAALWGTHRVVRRSFPVGRGPVRMAFGTPVAVPADGSRRERADRVVDDCRESIRSLLARLVAADPPR
jgi:1-acyl-sn-glycerol-3-phosphate acyltransferase